MNRLMSLARRGDGTVPPEHGVLRARRTWLMPIILVIGLAAALPAIYLSANADPQGHLEGLPVALVVETPSTSAGADSAGAAGAVGDAIEQNAGASVEVTRMTSDELDAAMRTDRVAGAVIIPSDFDSGIASLLPGSAAVTVPTVRIATNAGDGGLSSGLVVANLTPVLHGVAERLGAQLIEAAAPSPGATAVPAAHLALMAEPFRIVSGPFEPLPENSGLGTSAFYYALILVLIAFIGASVVNPLVDASLGVIPSELGPLVARRPYTAVTRIRTFLAKAAVLAVASPLAAGALLGVAALIGVTPSDPAQLWLFGTAVIAAIGTSALAVLAALGPGIGSLVNTLFFVALAMVSSGGIVPLDAAPPFFRLLSAISPFRHVVDGTRSLFFFDAAPAAGLADAWISVVVGGTIGLMLGIAVTALYGRVRRFSRHPRPLALPTV